MTPAQLKKRVGLPAVLLVLIGTLSYVYFFYVQRDALSSGDGWYFEEKGLAQAIEDSKQYKRPLLLYFTRNPCRNCGFFENDYLTDSDFIAASKPMLKVKITANTNRQTQSLADKYQVVTYPSMVIKASPESPPIKLHVLMGLNQVWLPSPTYLRGNYTPLSMTTLTLAMKRTLILAHDLKEGKLEEPKKLYQ